ncbi:MAG: stage II sporulation protein R [Oscillospiraceae bacterium]|nr:stage II sporulation protein R [Oscillospiraceae bacterium]
MICLLVVCLVWCGGLIADRTTLREELIRLHVVAASDSQEDQSLKLLVRDAVVESLQSAMAELTDPEAAKAYLRQQLPQIQLLAEHVLRELGCEDSVQVSLALEEFGTRVYDTFTLPAGIYESLRIVIGEGAGQNWWCVVFPTLCVPATSDGFEDTAAGAGFSDSLTGALTGDEEYEVRFYLLDVLGNVENLLHRG